MRILHTSDWHLGRSFHGFSLHHLTADFLAELCGLVKERSIDAVLVSGDVYDRAQPRTETIRLLSQALEQLSEAGCTVILSSGNHDSAARLGFAAKILAKQGIHVVTRLDEVGQPIFLEPTAPETVQVAVYPIPFLEPRSTARAWNTAPSHQAVVSEACRRITEDMAGSATSSHSGARVNLMMAHCFASGAYISDSERDLTVGGLETVGIDTFSGIDYVALGHLHGRQKLADNVRYSGSPLAFSFSEERHTKGAWILDINDSGKIEVDPYEWKTTLELVTLKGTLDELLTEEMAQEHGHKMCRIYLTDRRRPLGAMEQLREHFGTIAELFFIPEGVETKRTSPQLRQSQTIDPHRVCTDFFTHVRSAELAEDEQEYVEEIIAQVAAQEGK